MINKTTATKYDARIQHHAVYMQQKAQLLFAFVATMLFLCIEEVKAFAAPLAKPDALLFMASGAHSAKRWGFNPSSLNIRPTTQDKPTDDKNLAQKELKQQDNIISRTHRNKVTCMKMTFGSTSTTDSAPILDMKTSLNAFGGWYNTMDPVARPPDYDE